MLLYDNELCTCILQFMWFYQMLVRPQFTLFGGKKFQSEIIQVKIFGHLECLVRMGKEKKSQFLLNFS